MSTTATKLRGRALREIDSDELEASDPRAGRLTQAAAISPDLMGALEQVFAGTELLEDRKRLSALVVTRAEINGAWASAAKGFILVGQRLLTLDDLLYESERTALMLGCERLFPFSKSVASKLRAVARAVRDKMLTPEDCPASYTIAYEITRLGDDLLPEARRRGLVSPGVTRTALLAFKREHAPLPPPVLDTERLVAERRRIDDQLAALEQRRQALEARRAEIDRITQAIQGGER